MLVLIFLCFISVSLSSQAGLRPGGRIIGGEEAGPTDAPWQVSLRNFLGGISHFCGGSIVSQTWVLTAAHCLDGLAVFQFDVMAGQHNIHLPDIHQQVRLVSQAIIHPNYTWDDKEFDIGLIKLQSPLQLTDYVQPVGLATEREPQPGTVCEATGWGVTQEDGFFLAANLQKVSLPLVSDQTCYQTYQYLMRDDMICAGEEGKDSCSGDSGGPLVCPQPGQAGPVLVGVTSWGQGCGRPGKPGVYTEVAYFYDWIRDTIADHSA